MELESCRNRPHTQNVFYSRTTIHTHTKNFVLQIRNVHIKQIHHASETNTVCFTHTKKHISSITKISSKYKLKSFKYKLKSFKQSFQCQKSRDSIPYFQNCFFVLERFQFKKPSSSADKPTLNNEWVPHLFPRCLFPNRKHIFFLCFVNTIVLKLPWLVYAITQDCLCKCLC